MSVKQEPVDLEEFCQRIIQICEQIPDGINDKVSENIIIFFIGILP